MYLRGFGGSLSVRMPNQSVQIFSGITSDLDAAFKAGGVPLKADGSAYSLTNFQGGYLLDGCPLNVVFGQGWLPGQTDALKAAGLTNCPQFPLPPVSTPPLQIPGGAPPTNFNQVPAPGFVPVVTSASGGKIVPTGVVTPTAATITPGGVVPIDTGPPMSTTQAGAPATDTAGAGPILLAVLAIGWILGRR